MGELKELNVLTNKRVTDHDLPGITNANFNVVLTLAKMYKLFNYRILFLEKQTSKRENLSWSLRMSAVIFVVRISGEMVALTVFISGWNMPASARSYFKS